jgi:hypothetical protein
MWNGGNGLVDPDEIKRQFRLGDAVAVIAHPRFQIFAITQRLGWRAFHDPFVVIPCIPFCLTADRIRFLAATERLLFAIRRRRRS